MAVVNIGKANIISRTNICDFPLYSPKNSSTGSRTLNLILYSRIAAIKHKHAIITKNTASLISTRYFVIDSRVDDSSDPSNMLKENARMFNEQTNKVFVLTRSRNTWLNKHCFSSGWSFRKRSHKMLQSGAMTNIRAMIKITPLGTAK